mmetsp:Transcript_24868/g.59904  ORF Transcript_24868/g.59904 Transcript_24868/m.59904 type:complete len:239 (+) Transcript_24868:156-872(+)
MMLLFVIDAIGRGYFLCSLFLLVWRTLTYLVSTNERLQPTSLVGACGKKFKSIWNRLLILTGYRHQTFNVLLLGEFGSGRSSLIRALKGEPFERLHLDTLHAQRHDILYRGTLTPTINLSFYEMSDQEPSQRLIPDYFHVAHGVLYIINIADNDTLSIKVKENLRSLVTNDVLRGKPILVLGNKFDLAPDVNSESLKIRLGLQLNKVQSPIELFICSVKQNVGYSKGLEWLHRQFIKM